MQAESEIDKCLAALCRWLQAINDDTPADMHRADIDAAYPCWETVTVPSNIAKLRELLSDCESRIDEARSQSRLVVEFNDLYELLRRVYREKAWDMDSLLASREASELRATRMETALSEAALEASQLNQKLRQTEIDFGGLIQRTHGARGSQDQLQNVHDAAESGSSQATVQHETLQEIYAQIRQDRNELRNRYNNLLQNYQQSEASIKQLVRGRQRRDSGLEDQATILNRTTSLPCDPQALHASIECSVSLLHGQGKGQQDQLNELTASNDKLQAELAHLREDNASLQAQNVMSKNSLSNAQQSQGSSQDKVYVLQHECTALWEHLLDLEAAKNDTGGEAVQNLKLGKWWMDAQRIGSVFEVAARGERQTEDVVRVTLMIRGELRVASMPTDLLQQLIG